MFFFSSSVSTLCLIEHRHAEPRTGHVDRVGHAARAGVRLAPGRRGGRERGDGGEEETREAKRRSERASLVIITSPCRVGPGTVASREMALRKR